MCKKGFTLVELVAVIVLIAIISLISFPVINSLRNSNNEKIYKTYEKLMIEYVKTIPINKYTNKEFVCLKEMNLKNINENTICEGYVKLENEHAYIRCYQNEKLIYNTNGYVDDICS